MTGGKNMDEKAKLKLYPLSDLARNNPSDPIRYYYWPIIGPLYRRRVELCLSECRGGERILEVGFGIGLTFQNLAGLYQEVHGIDLMADVEKVSRFFEEKGIRTHLRNGNVLQMPYPDNMFDTVLLISILEHLKPEEQSLAMTEIKRVLKPRGQLVYGVPVERPLMAFIFRLMGYDIRKLHFSTEKDVSQVADIMFQRVKLVGMKNPILKVGSIYQIGHYIRQE
jgi:ubiquinone/menaquinone biosynthesis C-methylase UbiE